MLSTTQCLEGMKKNWKTIIMVVISFILLSGLYTTFFINQQY